MKRERVSKRKTPPDPAAHAWLMIFLLVFLIGIAMFIDHQRRVSKVVVDPPIPGRFWGNPQGQLRITQFWDLQNPEGVRGERLVEKYLLLYPDQIFYQLRYFPQDEKSLLITLYAECANRQKKFRPFVKFLFLRQSQWMSLASVSPVLKNIASEAGIDLKELSSCVASQDAIAVVSLDRVYGESLFVKSTPAYFLNGKMAEGVDAFEKALQGWEDRLIDE